MLTKQAELAAISAIQSAIDREGLDWVAGETSMSRLSAEEKARLGVARVGPPIEGVPIESRPLRLQGVADPPIFDWRDVGGHNWMTTVRHQGRCGSCWAFSASGTIEAAFNIYSGNPNLDIDISEQHVVSDCCYKTRCGDCSGGWPDWTLKYCRDLGIPDEACFPYIARNCACNTCDDVDDRRHKITGYKYINSKIEDFKWALQEYGAMCVVLTIPDDWYYYTAGVYSPTSEGVGWANHAVVLVGWDDARGAWIIKNSYGEGWGGTGKGYGLVDFGVLEGYNYAYAVTGIIHEDAPVSCDGPTEHFSSGCDLLLHYDHDGDGAISIGEMGDATDDMEAGDITEDEYNFVIGSYYDDAINTTCPECYSADVVTCAGRTEHFSSGCDLLLAYDSDGDGIITWQEYLSAFYEYNDGKINAYEAAFVERAYDAGSINNLCPGCYSEDENIAPTATATATPTFGTPPLSVQFTGQGTDPDGTIQSYNWNFGDGNTTNVQNPQHTYSNVGAYSSKLTVTDNDGATGTDNVTISVSKDAVDGWIKPISAESSSNYITDDGFEYSADLAIDDKWDGVGTDCWVSDKEVPCWIRFDLGSEKTIDAVRIVSLTNPLPMTVSVDVSSDDISWIPVTSDVVINDSYIEVEVAITQSTARYVRLNIVDVSRYVRYGGCCEFDVHVVDDTVANIEVVSFTVTPQTCQTPCDTAISITWENTGTATATFTPGYTVDGTLYSSSSITLIPGQQGLLRETVTGLVTGSYEICPVPN